MPLESKKSLDETLDEIAKDSMRSKIVRLREIFDRVEAAKASGASNKAIVEGLKQHGLIFDVNNFKNARSRILKERAMEALAQAASGEKKNQQVTSPSKPVTSSKPVVAEAKPSGRKSVLLNNDKGIFAELNPAPANGTVDLKQK